MDESIVRAGAQLAGALSILALALVGMAAALAAAALAVDRYLRARRVARDQRRKSALRVPPRHCPECGANVFEHAAPVEGIDLFQPGRTPICHRCAEALIFASNGELRRLTADELLLLERTGEARDLRAIQQVILNRGAGRRLRPWRKDRPK